MVDASTFPIDPRSLGRSGGWVCLQSAVVTDTYVPVAVMGRYADRPAGDQMWHGWARGHLWSPKSQRVSVSCTGTQLFYLDGEGFPGANYAGTQLWATTNVEKGTHVIAAQVTTLCFLRL